MELLSLRLRPIEPAHAARAIERFLSHQSLQGDGLSSDVASQLKGMQAALQKGKRRSRFSSSSSSSSSSEAVTAAVVSLEGEGETSGKRRRL